MWLEFWQKYGMYEKNTEVGVLTVVDLFQDSALFFFQAEDGIRDCLLSRGLGDVYKRQPLNIHNFVAHW